MPGAPAAWPGGGEPDGPEPDDGIDRSRMRGGFTTGSAAAAAALGAALLLRDGVAPAVVALPVPAGVTLHLPLASCERLERPPRPTAADSGPPLVGAAGHDPPLAANGPRAEPDRRGVAWAAARASVVKDGGDDPDCTHGAEIVTEVRLLRPAPGEAGSPAPGSIRFRAGPGVGTITKPGLELPPGEPAINPVPRRMIAAALRSVLGDDLGGLAAEVTVAVPDGEARAGRTLNVRLGIVGGLSILGTSGLVLPYSTAAFRASIRQAVEIARAQGVEEVVFTTGGRSEKFAMARFPHLPEEAFVQMGDFVGFALGCARQAGMRRVTLCNMVGKAAKLAQGRLMTHAAGSEVDTRFLASLAAAAGAPPSLVEAVATANTARHAAELVDAAKLTGFYEQLCGRAADVASAHVEAALPVTVVLTDFDGRELARASRG